MFIQTQPFCIHRVRDLSFEVEEIKKITRYKVHFHILYLTYMTTNNHFFFRWGEEKKLTLWRIYMRSRRRFIIDQKENMTEYVASHGGNNVRAVKLKINSRLITM